MTQKGEVLHSIALKVLCDHEILKACDKHADQYLAGDNFMDVDAQSHVLIKLWKLNPDIHTGELTRLFLELRRTHGGSSCRVCNNSSS